MNARPTDGMLNVVGDRPAVLREPGVSIRCSFLLLSMFLRNNVEIYSDRHPSEETSMNFVFPYNSDVSSTTSSRFSSTSTTCRLKVFTWFQSGAEMRRKLGRPLSHGFREEERAKILGHKMERGEDTKENGDKEKSKQRRREGEGERERWRNIHISLRPF